MLSVAVLGCKENVVTEPESSRSGDHALTFAKDKDKCPSNVKYAGRKYATVQIGGQCWMQENLGVGVRVDGTQEQSDNGTIEKYSFNDDPAVGALYGGLYQWNEAMQFAAAEGAQGICPPGWHIPTLAEFQTLVTAANYDGNALKAIGQGSGIGVGTNTTGFSALLAGIHADGFSGLGSSAGFWCSTESGVDAYFLSISGNSGALYLHATSKNVGMSIRCIMD